MSISQSHIFLTLVIAVVRIFAGTFVGRLRVGLPFLRSTSAGLLDVVVVLVVTKIRAGGRTGFLALFLLALGLFLVVVISVIVVVILVG